MYLTNFYLPNTWIGAIGGSFYLQEDKDLVHEFVQNDGLDCLIKVGSDVDQNYQNYILRGEFAKILLKLALY